MRSAPIKTSILTLLALTAAISASASCALASAGTVLTGGAASSAAPAARQISPRPLATWFGPGFYGQRTACGQVLTPALVGVAHRTLPCGTLVSFTYRGRRLTVPVIDRGPYANGAEWDLTGAAARALGMTDTARIAARVVGSAPNSPLLGQPTALPVQASTGGISAA